MSMANGHSDSDTSRVKTLGIRFEGDIHADLTLIAGLRGTSFQAQVIEACRALVASVKASPELASKADDVLLEIEREAAARRDAFARLFGNGTESPTGEPTLLDTTDDPEEQDPTDKSTTPPASPPTPANSRKSGSTTRSSGTNAAKSGGERTAS